MQKISSNVICKPSIVCLSKSEQENINLDNYLNQMWGSTGRTWSICANAVIISCMCCIFFSCIIWYTGAARQKCSCWPSQGNSFSWFSQKYLYSFQIETAIGPTIRITSRKSFMYLYPISFEYSERITYICWNNKLGLEY